MHETSAPTPVIHFGVFEVDLRAGDLRKQGLKIKLHGQPMEVLAMLLEHPGEVVTREEIHHRLWPGNTFVDFEHSINTAIKKLREALGDDADKPRYIETLPRKGYRFVYPVAAVSPIAGPIGIGPSESENRTPPPGTAPPRPLTPGPSPAGRGEEGVTEGGRSPTGRGETVSAFQPSPTGRGWPTGTGEGAPHPSSGGYTRRVVRALVDAALDAHRAQTRWQRLALVGIAAAALAVGLAVLVALNVAGLRERIVGAGLSRQDGGDVKSPLPKIESIAVLPLENLSHDPEQDYFADGMTEALITNLGKIRALRVISRTTAMHFKGTNKTLPEIARELNVDAVVEGSVLRSGNRVRVTANLLHAPTDRHLWANTYESDMQDVLVLQGEVARAIAEEVRIKLTPDEQVRLTATRPVKPEAYEAYLKGCLYASRLTASEDGRWRAVDQFQQAIKLDPTFAPAHAGLASVYANLGHTSSLAPMDAYPQARVAALKALELDNTLPEAHVALSWIELDFEWDWAGAEREAKFALALNPRSVKAINSYSRYLTFMGRVDEAISMARQADQQDPFAPSNLAWVYFNSTRYDEAISFLRDFVARDPTSWYGHYFLAGVYAVKGSCAEALNEAEKGQCGTACKDVYALCGQRRTALRYIREEEALSKRTYLDLTLNGFTYALLGDTDKAIECFEKGYTNHAVFMVYLKMLAQYPQFSALRSDPRFQDLLRRMNFPP